MQADVYKMLRTVLEQTDVTQFEQYMEILSQRLHLSPLTQKFASYFDKYWKNNKTQWGYCFRVGDGINTNMFCEAFHRVFKYSYLHGKHNRRVDTCLLKLIKFNQDKIFQRLIKLTKGKNTSKANLIYKRHTGSLSLSFDDVQVLQDSQEWKVKSENNKNNYYKVKEVVTHCTQEHCRLQCLDCNICIHRYCCTCTDFLMNNISCKHIHLVHRNRIFNTDLNQPVLDDAENIQPIHDDTGDTDRNNEIDILKNMACAPKSTIAVLKEQVAIEVASIIAATNSCNYADEENLKMLLKKLKATKHTFESVMENRMVQSIDPKKLHSRQNVQRQRRFVSTKKKRKPCKVKLAKPSLEEKSFFMEVPTWLLELDVDDKKEKEDIENKAVHGEYNSVYLDIIALP